MTTVREDVSYLQQIAHCDPDAAWRLQEMKQEFIADRSDALYRDDDELAGILANAESPELIDELVRLIRAVDSNNVYALWEFGTGIRDRAKKLADQAADQEASE
jgi:hypothetical protein